MIDNEMVVKLLTAAYVCTAAITGIILFLAKRKPAFFCWTSIQPYNTVLCSIGLLDTLTLTVMILWVEPTLESIGVVLITWLAVWTVAMLFVASPQIPSCTTSAIES